MIRVNLVEAGRQRGKPAGLALLAGQELTVAGSLILLVTALLVGWSYWSVTQDDAALDGHVAAAKQEEAKLTAILQEVQGFESRREQLRQRVGLIDDLRKGQAAPVHMIDQVSRALPEGMWLTKLQQAGFDITIEGECLSLTALSDFVGNLETSTYFMRPVEILDSAVVPAREGLPDVIRFSVKGTFQMAGIEPEPAQTGTSVARGGNGG